MVASRRHRWRSASFIASWRRLVRRRLGVIRRHCHRPALPVFGPHFTIVADQLDYLGALESTNSITLSLISSDVVLETRVLVSRCLEDKNESLGLGLGL